MHDETALQTPDPSCTTRFRSAPSAATNGLSGWQGQCATTRCSLSLSIVRLCPVAGSPNHMHLVMSVASPLIVPLLVEVRHHDAWGQVPRASDALHHRIGSEVSFSVT